MQLIWHKSTLMVTIKFTRVIILDLQHNGHDTSPVLRLPHLEGGRWRPCSIPVPFQRRAQEAPRLVRSQWKGQPEQRRQKRPIQGPMLSNFLWP